MSPMIRSTNVIQLLLVLLVSQTVDADTIRLPTKNLISRELFEQIAGYNPTSPVTDHKLIDLDQEAIETQLQKKTEEAFQYAQAIFELGAHSKSYAEVKLDAALATDVAKNVFVAGVNEYGATINAKTLRDAKAGDTTLSIQYETGNAQSNYVGCQVGALSLLGEQITIGCFVASGDMTMAGSTLGYTYDVNKDNKNDRSIAEFSSLAKEKMEDCASCPYKDYSYFKNYYGDSDYANLWITAALSGEKTDFTNSRVNADFSLLSFNCRAECIKKGTVGLNIFMHVIREFEDALVFCADCAADDSGKGCGRSETHNWDKGVAFYSGSLEGEVGTGDGKLLFALADTNCQNFTTCGVNGDGPEGRSFVNTELIRLFTLGKNQLVDGLCDQAEVTKNMITDLMYVPLIQGVLRSAYMLEHLNGDEKIMGEGATVAAAVLPRIHAADENAANVIYNNMKVGVSTANFKAVKEAFESTYDKINVDCKYVGGLWDSATLKYYPGAEPCTFGSRGLKKWTYTGITLVAIANIALIGVVYRRKCKKVEHTPEFEDVDRPVD